MVGSRTSRTRRTKQWGRTRCHGEVLVKAPRVFFFFFFFLLLALTNKNDIIMDWHCGAGLYSPSSKLSFSLSILLFLNFIVLHSLTCLLLDVLGDSVIACHFIQCHSVALEADSNIFNALLLPMRDHDSELTRLPHTGGLFLLHLLEDGEAQFWFSLWASIFFELKLVCLHFFLLHSLFHAFTSVFFSSFSV